MNSIGELILQKRKENRITQKQLADLLHLTPSAISKWENDVAVPHISQFPQIADALQIPVEELFALTIDDFRYTSPSTAELEIKDTTPEDLDIPSTYGMETQSSSEKSKKCGIHYFPVMIVLIVTILLVSVFIVAYRNSKEPVFKVVDEYFSTEMPYFNHTEVYYVIIEFEGNLTEEYLQAYEPELRSTYEDKFHQSTVILIQFYDSYEGFNSNSTPDMKLVLLPTARN